MSYFDVSVGYPALATETMDVTSGEEVAPASGPFTGSLLVDAGFFRFNGCTFVVSGSGRVWDASWDIEPAFAARAWEAALDFGLRWSPDDKGQPVNGWWEFGTGARLGVLTADWWSDVYTPGLGAHTGIGVVMGRGRVRPTGSLRLDVSARFDTWNGTLVASDATTTWSYHPGGARLTAFLGVEWGPRADG